MVFFKLKKENPFIPPIYVLGCPLFFSPTEPGVSKEANGTKDSASHKGGDAMHRTPERI